MSVQTPKWRTNDVAARQQEKYSQLIHNFGGRLTGQLVGDLWISGGLSVVFPHGGLKPDQYAQKRQLQASILSKFAGNQNKS